MRVIKAHDYLRMPWKNGGGETLEIAAVPEGAGLEQFDWRVSMARVAGDGPFSVFPGVDRTLALLEGNGLWLAVNDQWPVELLPGSAPFSFSGEASTRATLVRGEVVDFNVMTRRGRWRHEVTRQHFEPEDVELVLDASLTLVFCQQGATRVQQGSQVARIGVRDSLVFDDSHARGEAIAVRPESPLTLLVAKFWPAGER